MKQNERIKELAACVKFNISTENIKYTISIDKKEMESILLQMQNETIERCASKSPKPPSNMRGDEYKGWQLAISMKNKAIRNLKTNKQAVILSEVVEALQALCTASINNTGTKECERAVTEAEMTATHVLHHVKKLQAEGGA